jgi:DNA-binding transcriptional ArsR family regulator
MAGRNAAERRVAQREAVRSGAPREDAARTRPAGAVKKVAPTPASLDRLIHDRTRLAIISALAAQQAMSFSDLKAATETTDGNLSVHARKLEEAGYVACTKGFDGRLPRTEFSLTDAGRKALKKYLDHMEAIIQGARAHGDKAHADRPKGERGK